MTDTLSIAIAGIAGRMGRQLVSAAHDKGHKVTGGSEHPESLYLTEDIGTLAGKAALGVTPSTDLVSATTGASVWIDFTRPYATLAALAELQTSTIKTIIIGTTGFTPLQDEAIVAHKERFTIVKAGNFSLGIAFLTAMTRLAAEKLGPGWDLEILETHHRHKIDAPSGTALMLGEAAAAGRGKPLKDLRLPPYNGPSAKRVEDGIGFAVRRAGGIIGEHDVTLTTETEQITLAHKALDRRVFAEGALKAAEWASKQAPGLYTIRDVLGI